MTEKKTKEEVLREIDQAIEECCINIGFELLQENEIKLIDGEVLSLADEFYKKLDHQNNKVIVTGDGKYGATFGLKQ